MKILFIFDKVMHYHVSMLKTLEQEFERNGHQLYLFSGVQQFNSTGRVGLPNKVIQNEEKYMFKEICIGNYTLRWQHNILKKIINLKPDTVIFSSHVGNVSNWMVLKNKKRLNYKVISWQCGYEYNENRIKQKILASFLKNFDFHLAYHNNAKKYLQKYNVDPEKIEVVFNTIDENEIPLLPKEEAKKILSDEIPISKDMKIILYVGAILKEKKLELLVDGFLNLNADNVILLIIGDGDYSAFLESKYRGKENVIFLGRIINDVGKYFDAADIFVLPGTGGLAINEAMAHGLPIVSSYADGSADDLVLDSVNGYRLNKNSPDEISSYLQTLLTNDRLRESMGNKSYEMIRSNFCFNNFIQRIYKTVTEKVVH